MVFKISVTVVGRVVDVQQTKSGVKSKGKEIVRGLCVFILEWRRQSMPKGEFIHANGFPHSWGIMLRCFH
jgi:hypothetical protein